MAAGVRVIHREVAEEHGTISIRVVGYGVVAAGDGSVVGGFLRLTATDSSGWIRRYDADGNALWTVTHVGDVAGSNGASDLVEDAAGNVFAVGWETSAAGGIDGWIVKLDPGGQEIWSQSLDEAGFEDRFRALALDSAGDPVVVGSVQAAENANQGVILKFDR